MAFLIIILIGSLFLLKEFIQNEKIKSRKSNGTAQKCHVGIFHPYCNAGGGGERVLWCAVRALQNE